MNIDISTKKFPDTYMQVDKEDWSYLCGLGIGKVSPCKPNKRPAIYAQCWLNGKVKAIHRLLLQEPKGLVVDHINHNGLDNRKVNLRACTVRENLSNMRNQGASKYTGVFGEEGKWRSRVEVGGGRGSKREIYYTGTFKTEIEASNAYTNKLKELNIL